MWHSLTEFCLSFLFPLVESIARPRSLSAVVWIKEERWRAKLRLDTPAEGLFSCLHSLIFNLVILSSLYTHGAAGNWERGIGERGLQLCVLLPPKSEFWTFHMWAWDTTGRLNDRAEGRGHSRLALFLFCLYFILHAHILQTFSIKWCVYLL